MFGRSVTFLLVLWAGIAAGLAADGAAHRDLVVGSGADAVRIRLVLTVDGQPLAAKRRDLVESVVQTADENKDGQLSEAEWRHALALIGDPSAKRSDVPEMAGVAAALTARLGAAMEFVEQPRPLVDRLDLFEALDEDKDGRLQKAEFVRAPELLDWYDADADGTLGMPELAPNEPLQPMPVSRSATLPKGRYPFSWEDSTGEADAVVEMRLISRAFGRPKVEGRVVEVEDEAVSIEPGRRSVTLKVGGLSVVLDARASLISPEDVKRFYLLQMRRRDGDQNGYLDESEFIGLALPELSFDIADANGDEKLFSDELREKLDGLIVRETNRVRVEVAYEREALFTRLDRDRDERLSRRELLAAPSSAESNAVALADFGGRYRLEFGVPNLLEEASPQMAAGAAAMAQARMAQAGEGPDWFRAMDRNGDGDLSRREFLASSKRFSDMDADGNGLIGLEEATDKPAGKQPAVDEAGNE